MIKRVLLVEDNPDDHVQVKWALRNIPNLVVEIAVNGQEGVRFLLDHEKSPPHLVLLDVKMPLMNGLEALCSIREKESFASLPIVIFSSSNEPSDIAAAKRCRATEFVQKPVNFEKYNETVRRIVREYAGV